MTPVLEDEFVQLYQGDCLEVLRELADSSVDAIVTDPPAGIEFMGKEWDSFRGEARQPGDPTFHRGEWRQGTLKVRHGTTPGYGNDVGAIRSNFIHFMATVMSECLRVLKPGGHALVWAIPRTSHWTATAVEDAGFEIRDVITHHFGSGFPKSLDVSKAIDKAAGAEREVLGSQPDRWTNKGTVLNFATDRPQAQVPIVGPAATDAAKRWSGWGTALKPASEHWVLARKPLSEANVAANVLRHGTGAINIDGTRIGISKNVPASLSSHGARSDGVYEGNRDSSWGHETGGAGSGHDPAVGRWPANLIISHASQCKPVGRKTVKSDGHYAHGRGQDGVIDTGLRSQDASHGRYVGEETVEAWECAEGCPVRLLNEQSGERLAGSPVRGDEPSEPRANTYGDDWTRAANPGYADVGGAARFFKTFSPKHETMNATWSVQSAEELSPGVDNIVLGIARESALPVDETKAVKSRSPVFGVDGSSQAISPPSANTAPINAQRILSEPPARPVVSAASQSDSPATSSAPSTAPMSLAESVESQVGRDFMPEPENVIPSHNPVPVAVSPESTGTIPTITIPTGSSGSAPLATGGDTRWEGVEANIASDPLFAYSPKADRGERNSGLEGLEERPMLWSSGTQNPGSFQAEGTRKQARNFHPTVKPIDLMRYLCRMITPPGGTVLDCFAGSGSTGVAAKLEGFHCILIEREADYVEIAKRRLGWAVNQPGLFD